MFRCISSHQAAVNEDHYNFHLPLFPRKTKKENKNEKERKTQDIVSSTKKRKKRTKNKENIEMLCCSYFLLFHGKRGCL